MSNFSEKNFVQDEALRILSEELGWRIEEPNNIFWNSNEKIPLFKADLWKSLKNLNEGISDAQIAEIIECLEKDTLKKFDLKTNKEKYFLIKEGVPATDENSIDRKKNFRIIDFANPENNLFTAVAELQINEFEDASYRKPDIIGFVNGIPLLFIECKNHYKSLRKYAYEGNYKTYLEKIPQLFAYNAFSVFSNGDQTKIGAVGSEWEFFSDWHRLKEGDEGDTKIENFLRGVCNKKNFLDLFENFTLFSESEKEGRIQKLIARNHQFLGVNRAFEAYCNRFENRGRLGVFWHTQGSGKSYSMLFFAKKIQRKCSSSQPFLILTDREDLHKQIYQTFLTYGSMGHDQGFIAHSQEDLLNKLKGSKKFVFSLIQKFKKSEELEQYSEIDKDWVIIVDEAHRTQYGGLAEMLYKLLPNSSRIGFTGTPLLKGEEKTAKLFGGYVSIYDFRQAVKDQITVPVYYESRTPVLKDIQNPEINDDFAKALEEETKEESKLSTVHYSLKDLLMSKDRLEKIAKDFVTYYSERIELGKALFVGIERISCVVMKNYVQKYWKEEIERLKASLPLSPLEEKEELSQRIRLMEETQIAYAISSGELNIEKIKNYGDDIEIEQEWKEREIEDKFKDRRDCLRIVFVCQKWLTGFDCQCLSFLFLDKPLREHTLMQAIARPNRVDVNKDKGFIIDYLLNKTNLVEAIKIYSDQHEREAMEIKSSEELRGEVNSLIEVIKNLLSDRNVSLENFINEMNIESKRKKLSWIEQQLKSWDNLSELKNNCQKLFRDLKFLGDKNWSKEIIDKFDGIKAIYNGLEYREDSKNSGVLSEAKTSAIMNEYLGIEKIEKHFSIDNLFDLKNEGSENNNSEIERNIENKKQDITKKIENNFQRKRSDTKKVNFQKELNEIIEKWNQGVLNEVEMNEQFKELDQRIEEDDNSYQQNGMKNFWESAIYEYLKEQLDKKSNADKRAQKFCFDIFPEICTFLKGKYQPFEIKPVVAWIRKTIKYLIIDWFPEFDVSSSEVESFSNFIFDYFSNLYTNHQDWFLEILKTYNI